MNNAHFAARVLALVPPKPRPARPDPATRLPIPVQAPCPGVPGEVACDRKALPGAGYCLRCGPIAAAVAREVAA